VAKDPLKDLEGDKPPKADKTAPKKRGPRKRTGQPTYPQIEEGLNSFVAMLGVGFKATGDNYCGDTILREGPALSASLIELAKQNPNVKRALVTLNQTSTWGGVVVAAAALAVPIMAHHGIIPATVASLVGAPLEGVDLESGGARHTHRTDRPGQDDTGPSDTPEADVLTGPSIET